MRDKSGEIDAHKAKRNTPPSKRLFLSIIADYDLNRSICELVDNALDVWVRGGRTGRVTIAVQLDKRQQTIEVQDDSGGLPRSDLRYVVGPGETGTQPTDERLILETRRATVAVVVMHAHTLMTWHHTMRSKTREIRT